MSQSRLEERVGRVKKIGVTRISGWKLTFDAGHSEGAFVNVEPTSKTNDVVEGVIYELTNSQIRDLDLFEGHPHFYRRMRFMYKNRPMYVYISFDTRYRTKAKPTREYVKYLVDGCKENNLRDTLTNITTLIQRKYADKVG
jgi:hypothetical protein